MLALLAGCGGSSGLKAGAGAGEVEYADMHLSPMPA